MERLVSRSTVANRVQVLAMFLLIMLLMRTRSVKFCLVSFFIDIELYYTSSCFQLVALAFFPSFFAAVVSSLCFTLDSNVLRTISKMALKRLGYIW